MFTAFSGVTGLVVPDNALTTTHRPMKKNPTKTVTQRYQALTDHYDVVIVPTGMKRPRHKTTIENTVNMVNKRVIDYLEDVEWSTIKDLNDTIAQRIIEINHQMRRKDGSTRFERFETEEREHLNSLPDTRFEEVT